MIVYLKKFSFAYICKKGTGSIGIPKNPALNYCPSNKGYEPKIEIEG